MFPRPSMHQSGWNCYSLKRNSSTRGSITAAQCYYSTGQGQTNPTVRLIALSPGQDTGQTNTSGHKIMIQVLLSWPLIHQTTAAMSCHTRVCPSRPPLLVLLWAMGRCLSRHCTTLVFLPGCHLLGQSMEVSWERSDLSPSPSYLGTPILVAVAMTSHNPSFPHIGRWGRRRLLPFISIPQGL